MSGRRHKHTRTPSREVMRKSTALLLAPTHLVHMVITHICLVRSESLIVLCALAGCDYIDGVHGIGLKKGASFVAKTVSQEVDQENFPENAPPSPTKRYKLILVRVSICPIAQACQIEFRAPCCWILRSGTLRSRPQESPMDLQTSDCI